MNSNAIVKSRADRSASKADQNDRPKKYLFEIVKQVEHFQAGTMQYFRDFKDPKDIKKRFIPFFPFLYEDVKNGRSIVSVQFQMLNPPLK